MLKIMFFLVCLLVFNPAEGQNCKFTVKSELEKEAGCEKDGVIKARIEGEDVDNGNINMDDIQYSIASVSGGFFTMLDNNGGNLTGIPAGIYKVTARAFCKKTNSWITITSTETVEMTSSHPAFDINKIFVNTEKMKPSLECSATGIIPVQIGSGVPPYVVTIIYASDATMTGKTYNLANEGILDIEDLPSGEYAFEVSDNCNYAVELDTIQLPFVSPEYEVNTVGAPKCRNTGAINMKLKNGTLPYMITFTKTPETYTGERTFTVDKDYVDSQYSITDLSQGDYSFTIRDECTGEDYSVEITETGLSVSIPDESRKASAICEPNGEATFHIEGGLAPFTIKMTSCTVRPCPFESITVSSAKDTVIKGLYPGDYKFTVIDGCNESIPLELTIDPLIVNIKVSTDPSSSCESKDGKARIIVSNATEPVTATLLNKATNIETPVEKATNIETPGESHFNIYDLKQGEYTFKVTDKCDVYTAEVLITANRLPVDAIVNVAGCGAADATIVVFVTQGVPDFALTVTGEALTSPIVNPPPSPQSDSLFFIDLSYLNLSGPQSFEIKIIDACGEEHNTAAIVDPKEGEEPPYVDVYADVFFKLPDHDPNCKDVLIQQNSVYNPNSYWRLFNLQPDFFEVTYVHSDDLPVDVNTLPPSAWQDVQYIDTLTFEHGYCQARKNKEYYMVYARYKDLSITKCNMLLDSIVFAPISVDTVRTSSCEDFSLQVTHRDSSIICLPYDIVLTGKDGEIKKTITEIYELNSFTIYNIPHGEYEIKIVENECTPPEEWQMGTMKSLPPPPTNEPAVSYPEDGLLCNEYTMTFTIDYPCYPYSWVLKNDDNPSETFPRHKFDTRADNLPGNRIQSGLKYGVNYSLCLVIYEEYENAEKEVQCVPVKQEKHLDNYKLDFTPHYCLPDTAKGYIRLWRDGAPRSLRKGTVIEYVSGKTIPPLLTNTVAIEGMTDYFPFSDSPFAAELKQIEEDVYRFKITDECDSYTVDVDYKKSNVKGFDYTSTDGCHGINISPKGAIYLGDVKQNSYFKIIETPPGIAAINQITTEGGNPLSIRESGKYVMQISAGNTINSCPFDTLSINYVKQLFSQDTDSIRHHICDDETGGYIKMKHKGGVGPFIYTLYDKGKLIDENTTGIFYYGTFGETYQVRIRDIDCRSSVTEDVQMLNLAGAKLVNDDVAVCKGDEIKLNCLSIGAYDGYLWSGPNGYSSTEQNPVIPDATLDMTGTYSIDVLPAGCSKRIFQNVNVDVIYPSPLADTTIFYCLNDVAKPLTVTPDPGNNLKWYDIDTVTHLPNAPTPTTNKIDTVEYFVSQVDARLDHCEGEKSKVTVIVQDFPDTVAYAYSNDICRGDYPLVVIPEVFEDYVYRLYDKDDAVVGIDTAAMDTLRIRSELDFVAPGLLYIEVETKHRCVSQHKSKVPVTVIHPVRPIAYDTFYCIGAPAVALRADSTAGHRLQWYSPDTEMLPAAPVPETGNVGTVTYFVAQVDILLGCVGDMEDFNVEIIEFPDTLIQAHAPDICRNTKPVVTVEKTYDMYTYTLFDRANDTLYSAVATGNPLNLYSSAMLSSKDTLFVEIQNRHKCTSKDRSIVPVYVEIPPAVPEIRDTVYCRGVTANPLYAVATVDGYSIQWYELDETPTNSPPVPPTDKVDTLYYNVTQKHNILRCESDTVQIQIIIDPSPDMAHVTSPEICPGRYPIIEIENTQEGYTYNVYSALNELVASREGSGDSIKITLSEPIYESAYYFVETINQIRCVSPETAKALTVVFNYMYLMPEKIPQYQRGKLYEVQLESNAVAPYEYYTETMLPTGFSLSTDGLISGTAPKNGRIDPVPFTVEIKDVNGCFAEREYLLESNIFVPQAFTPNGDGHNDVFMKGRRLVIFDRLGLKIFEGDDGWDGSRMDGAPAPPDTYFYIIYYEDENLQTKGKKEGYITLIRRK